MYWWFFVYSLEIDTMSHPSIRPWAAALTALVVFLATQYALPHAAAGQQPPPGVETRPLLQGVVVHETTGQPIESATVSLVGRNLDTQTGRYGDFAFRDSAETAKIADYEFSWGMAFEDLNLDGRDDLVVSENYIGLPPHKVPFLRAPGRLMIQNTQNEFAAIGKEAGVVNKRYSIAPIHADFNQDGYPDIVHVNLSGRSQAFISQGGEAGFLKVKLPNRPSSIAAVVEVTLDNGDKQTKVFVSGEGLNSDPSHILTFGIGEHRARKVSVEYIGGSREEREVDLRNSTLKF